MLNSDLAKEGRYNVLMYCFISLDVDEPSLSLPYRSCLVWLGQLTIMCARPRKHKINVPSDDTDSPSPPPDSGMVTQHLISNMQTGTGQTNKVNGSHHVDDGGTLNTYILFKLFTCGNSMPNNRLIILMIWCSSVKVPANVHLLIKI